MLSGEGALAASVLEWFAGALRSRPAGSLDHCFFREAPDLVLGETEQSAVDLIVV